LKLGGFELKSRFDRLRAGTGGSSKWCQVVRHRPNASIRGLIQSAPIPLPRHIDPALGAAAGPSRRPGRRRRRPRPRSMDLRGRPREAPTQGPPDWGRCRGVGRVGPARPERVSRFRKKIRDTGRVRQASLSRASHQEPRHLGQHRHRQVPRKHGVSDSSSSKARKSARRRRARGDSAAARPIPW